MDIGMGVYTGAAAGGDPASATPPRRPGSVRRTTTHDCAWPQGFDGPVTMVARGRDLLTTAEGEAVTLASARLDVAARYREGLITEVRADPPHPGTAALAGPYLFAGYRRALSEALPGEGLTHSVRFQLLDELPAALLASGRSLRAGGAGIRRSGGPKSIDVCAGWASGGELLANYSDLGPPLRRGPQAPVLEPADDPLAWHAAEPLPPHATRRRRRLDIWREGEEAVANAFFRDSHVDGDGVETIVHEWALQARIDPVARCFLSGAARTGPLPYSECPSAAASAGRLADMPIDGLRRAVGKAFVGPSTCTHLNDTFRSLEDAGALLDILQTGRPAG